MIIRAAHEADTPVTGHVMVETYLAAHRDQMPAEAWARLAPDWSRHKDGHAPCMRLPLAGTDRYPWLYHNLSHPPDCSSHESMGARRSRKQATV